jgi:hypothetical protein
MNLITDTIQLYLPAKRKTTPSGWVSFNAVCCNDTRQRGGFIVNEGDAISYHCFNCGFKCSWQPGRQLSKNMKAFLRHLNVPDDLVTKLVFAAIKYLHEHSDTTTIPSIPRFDARALPLDAKPILDFINDVPEELFPVLEYMNTRNLFLEDYNFYWTPRTGFNNRLIMPYYYKGKIVGYTARAVNNDKTRYLAEQQPGYVFNLDAQTDNRTFVIVCEGPIDAISISGCALLGSEIKDQQDILLKQLRKEIVLVPDRDAAGEKLVSKALEYGWSVSMPDYPPGIKDINDAVVQLGRLATLWLIVTAKKSGTAAIAVRAKQWFKETT